MTALIACACFADRRYDQNGRLTTALIFALLVALYVVRRFRIEPRLLSRYLLVGGLVAFGEWCAVNVDDKRAGLGALDTRMVESCVIFTALVYLEIVRTLLRRPRLLAPARARRRRPRLW